MTRINADMDAWRLEVDRLLAIKCEELNRQKVNS